MNVLEGYRSQCDLSFDEIRAICIKHNYYTAGSNENYEHLQTMVESKALIKDIASDIYVHSAESVRYSDVVIVLVEELEKRKGGVGHERS